MSEDAKNLLGWFGIRKKGLIMDGIGAHVLAVMDCVSELGTVIQDMKEGDSEGVKASINRLTGYEETADNKEDDLSEMLSMGDMSPQEREDLLHFVRKNDNIANWCKEAALYIQMIMETGQTVESQIWDGMTDMHRSLVSEVTSLRNALTAFDAGDSIMQCVTGVKEVESAIDRIYYDLVKRIYLSDMDFKAVMLACKVVDAIEQAADTCKGCADTIFILDYAKKV